MAQNTEIALLYNLKNSDSGRKLKMIFLQMKVRIRSVDSSLYLRSVGSLAGVRDCAPGEEQYEGEGFSEPMLLLRGFSDGLLNMLLAAMRRAGISIPLKAVLTAENQTWNSLELYQELQKEHEAFHGN